MHRSGTSALTRVLSYCGLAIPRTLVPANHGNPAGHWESKLVCEFNDTLLARVGLDWVSWRRATADLANERDYASLLDEGRRIVRREFGDDRDIVLKDPRICRLLPFWLDVFAQMDIKPIVVLAVRAPLQVAHSLRHRNAIRPKYALRAWLRFTLEAERASRELPRIVVSFDQLMADWRSEARALNESLADKILALTTETEQAVSHFLSPRLRHYAHAEQESSTPPCVARAYDTLLQWRERGETENDYKELDRIHRALNDAPAFVIRYGLRRWLKKWLSRQRERLVHSVAPPLDAVALTVPRVNAS